MVGQQPSPVPPGPVGQLALAVFPPAAIAHLKVAADELREEQARDLPAPFVRQAVPSPAFRECQDPKKLVAKMDPSLRTLMAEWSKEIKNLCQAYVMACDLEHRYTKKDILRHEL